VTLVASKDKVLSLEAVGYADVAAKRPMRTDNLFWIASMTKSMTATDVSRFCRMVLCGGVLDGKRYLSAKAVGEMTSTQTGRLPVAYGYGWFTDRTPGGPFGHGGAHKTGMHVDPRQGLVTVLMVQHTEWRSADGYKILPTFQ
jgi:CubicO group peptidase (beta-lactamase class C family)